MPPYPRFHSDEPTLDDHLGHATLVEAVAGLIEGCQAPYVLRPCGGRCWRTD